MSMKRAFAVFALLVSTIAVSTCAAPAQEKSKLTVWSFAVEMDEMIDKYYRQTHPYVTVDYNIVPPDWFTSELDHVLASEQGMPDIFDMESDLVRKYVESGLLLDLTDIYEANKSKLLAYPTEIGTYNGRVYAMSWQACTGAMFYRRSLAKKYLGTDDPKVVQSYFSGLGKLLETAKVLGDNSNGSCVVVSSIGDLLRPFLGARKNPWIVKSSLVIDPVMEQYMDVCKTLRDNRWEGRVWQWSEDWFNGMNGDLKDERGRRQEVFSYFFPAWGLHHVLKPYAPDTAGDWAMIPGPTSWYWGGTWIGASKNTKNTAAVKEFIRYLTTDDGFLEKWAMDKGDVVANTAVLNKIKNAFSEPFLAGQNHYGEFVEMVKNVNGGLAQGTDMVVNSLWNDAVSAFVNEEKSKAQALADFRRQVAAELGL